MDDLRLRIKNTFEAIPAANGDVSKWLESRKAPEGPSYLATLAIEELVTNCIKYGYDDKREHEIEISLSIAKGKLRLTVTDDGHEFNPLAIAEPDTSSPVEDRPIGGLGIHLLRKLADEMLYERRDGLNRVTIVKQLASSQSSRSDGRS